MSCLSEFCRRRSNLPGFGLRDLALNLTPRVQQSLFPRSVWMLKPRADRGEANVGALRIRIAAFCGGGGGHGRGGRGE